MLEILTLTMLTIAGIKLQALWWLIFIVLLLTSIQSIIQHLQSSLNGELSIDIRRDNLLKDALKEAKKKKFDPMKSLMVIYNPCSYAC